MEINPEIWKSLRAPLESQKIKWKIQADPRDVKPKRMPSGKESEVGDALVVAYIDARDVMDRLDEALPGQWESSYEVREVTPEEIAIECTITLTDQVPSGPSIVKRSDVGNGKEWKDAYSDALKRAAVQFGIGRFLYAFPQVKAEASKYGKSFYLTQAAERELFQLTEAILAGDERLPRFEVIKVKGYVPLFTGGVL